MRRQDFPYFLASLMFVSSLIALTFFGTAHGSESESECRTPTHCVMMSLPRFYMDLHEDDEERFLRLLDNANAIDAVTKDRVKRSALIMKAWKESRLARFVDLDLPRCRKGIDGWCDGGRAFGPIQAHGVERTITKVELYRIGLERLEKGGNYCTKRGYGYWEGAVSIYATGHSCKWKEAPARVEFMWKLAQRLGKAGG